MFSHKTFLWNQTNLKRKLSRCKNINGYWIGMRTNLKLQQLQLSHLYNSCRRLWGRRRFWRRSFKKILRRGRKLFGGFRSIAFCMRFRSRIWPANDGLVRGDGGVSRASCFSYHRNRSDGGFFHGGVITRRIGWGDQWFLWNWPFTNKRMFCFISGGRRRWLGAFTVMSSVNVNSTGYHKVFIRQWYD